MVKYEMKKNGVNGNSVSLLVVSYDAAGVALTLSPMTSGVTSESARALTVFLPREPHVVGFLSRISFYRYLEEY